MESPGYTPLGSFRYERKFLVEDLLACQVEGLVRRHPGLFRPAYPPRFVNNLYLDTPALDNYLDNLYGAERRRKVRVRWYGDPFGAVERPLLEIKVRQGLVGTKHSYPLEPLRVEAGFSGAVLQDAFAGSQLPPAVRLDLRGLDVVLFNRYYRRYYATRAGGFRLTLDSALEFYRVNAVFANAWLHRQRAARAVIVELKYAVEEEMNADRVAGFFPFPVTRSSKYMLGVERVYG